MQAAAVVVMQGSRILGFARFDKPGLSLPCGKVEPGESPLDAALRETKEETGYTVRPVVGSGGNLCGYTGYDLVGGMVVHTFKCEIVEGRLLPEAVGEGRACWASVRDVAEGPYWHYNRRAFAALGIDIPLRGKFHSHITVSTEDIARALKLSKGRLTMIELSREDVVQTDAMLTHHYLTGCHGLEDQYDVEGLLRSRGALLTAAGINVSRLKLEYDVLDRKNDRNDISLALARGIYTEIHVKCVVDQNYNSHVVSLSRELGWHPSRNVYAVLKNDVVQFVNKRIYGNRVSLEECDSTVDALVERLDRIHIEEIKYETAVMDTAKQHDHWWMK